MRIISWNINSIRARIDILKNYIREYDIDIVLLQETKVQDSLFPDIDMYCAYHGQKSYNGVAILSKFPINNIKIGFDSENIFHHEARIIEADINNINFISVYVPNGRAIDHIEYIRKREFFKLLASKKRNKQIIGGDFNVCPTDNDVYNPILWRNRISCTKPEREWYKIFKSDMVDPMENHIKKWTFWSYLRNGFNKDRGLRIDHFLISDIIISEACVHKHMRNILRPSDHAPIFIQCEDI